MTFDAEWRPILELLLRQDGDPFAAKVVAYGGTLNAVTAEPMETLAILRRNAREALNQFEEDRQSEVPWEVWALLELECRHLASVIATKREALRQGPSRPTTRILAAGFAVLWLWAGKTLATEIAAAAGAIGLLYLSIDAVLYVRDAGAIRHLTRLLSRFDRACRAASARL